MKTIEERIEEHEKLITKLNIGKEITEKMLDRINEKIEFHDTAIKNLKNRQYIIEQNSFGRTKKKL